MNRHLRKFIEDANDAYPENTEAATKQVKSEIKTLSATNEMTAKSMERELIEAGIKSLIDQERSRAKAVVKFTPQPISSQPNSSYTPRPANPPSNAIGSLTVAKNIMDDWFIGRGSNRTTLGAATRTVLEHEIDTESGIMDGHARNVAFYKTVASRLPTDTDVVKDFWNDAEIVATKAEIWKQEKADAVA